MTEDTRKLVRICGWCGEGLDPGAKEKFLEGWPATHGICGPCAAKVTREIEGEK